MSKHTLSLLAWLTSVMVLLIVIVGETAVSHAEPTAIEPKQYLPFVINPITDPEWLQYVNQFRELANLPTVSENSTYSAGAVLHSKYMVKNDEITHSEDSSNPWYTPEGAAAGDNGNVAVSSSSSASDEWAINLWMTGPFHAIGVLDPGLLEAGYGSYRESIGKWKTGATLDVLRGRGSIPAEVTFPIYFPGDGESYWLTNYGGNEWPDPLTSCPGYVSPSGPPLMIQLGSGSITPNITASSFKSSSGDLEHCVYDETNYVNSGAYEQNLGRLILNSRDAIVMMPKNPLDVGETYTVSLTNDATVYSWSFSVVASTNLTAVPLETTQHLFEIR
ncbi:MAG: CAP domain-containing protein [Chloroflexi bacterium]|nr:MAG: CAP domain-containing protein [Chloroflexota bacterium]